MYKPRNDLVLVRLFKKPEGQLPSGIVIPGEDKSSSFTKFKVIAIGPDVKDLKKGDIVIAEDVSQMFDRDYRELRLINQKYIHLIDDGK